MRRRLAALGAGAMMVAALAGCTEDEPRGTTASPGSAGTEQSPAQSPSPSRARTSGDDSGEDGGTAADPARVEPTPNLLAWSRVPGPATATVTRSGPWTLTINETGTRATLEGPARRARFIAGGRERISEALIADGWAVVVIQDRQETRPATANFTPLSNRNEVLTLDGSSEVPTTTGGTWALGEGQLVHPTIGPGGSYCLATVDLAERTSERAWCAERRHGFNAARITPEGTSLMTFDDQQPSCRTVVRLSGDDVVPFEGVEECLGWEGVLTADGAVWSVVPKQTRIEEARYYARHGEEYFDLGPGTSGTLVSCGDAAYFTQDPVRDGDPARLLRWTSRGALEIVYETRGGGPAFLTEPRCGGDRITVTALGESGDAQVTAPVD